MWNDARPTEQRRRRSIVRRTPARPTASGRVAAALLVAALGGLGAAQAGGLYLYEVSPADVGLASAGWAARAADASTIFKNPAGMEMLDDGGFVLAGQLLGVQTPFSPDRTATTTDGVDGDGGGLLPALGAFYARRVSDNIVVGVGMGGYFGLGLDYEDDWVGRYYVQEATLQSLALQPTASFRLGERFTLGVGVAAHYGILDQTTAVNNSPFLADPNTPVLPDGRLELDDTAWGFQGNIGMMWDSGLGARLGVQYLSEASLDFSTDPRFSGLRPALQAALASQGLLDSRLDLGMQLPQALRVGVMDTIGQDWEVMIDLGWEDWSRFGKVDVALATDPETSPASLTTESAYQDVWHVSAGASRWLSDSWRLLFGLAYDSSMVEDGDRSPALPVGETWRAGVGGELELGKGRLTVAYEYMYGGNLAMDVSRGPLAGRVAGEYEGAGMHVLSFGWTRRFGRETPVGTFIPPTGG